MKIQSYLTAAAVNLKRLAALEARLFTLWRACAARKRRMRAHRDLVRCAGLPLRRRVSRHTTRSQNRIFQQPHVDGWQRVPLETRRRG